MIIETQHQWIFGYRPDIVLKTSSGSLCILTYVEFAYYIREKSGYDTLLDY